MVPTVVLGVTLPPEGNALVVLAHKLEGRWGQEGLVGSGELRSFSFERLGCFKEVAGSGCLGGGRAGWDEMG